MLWTYRVVGSIIILLACLVLFMHTGLFRNWVRDFALETLNDQLLGKVVVDDIHIDLFRGIILTHPRLYADGQTVVEADSLIVRYDVAPLLRRIIVISELTLRNPQIYIQRRKGDSLWNIERIAKPNPDTATTELPDYDVIVRLLRITGGKVHVNDMNEEWPDSRYFSPTHISVRDFELRASARAALKKEDFSFAINRLSYTNNHSPFNVRELVTSVRLWHGGISIPTLSVKTDSSDFSLRAEMDSVDVFKDGALDSMRVHPMDAYLSGDRVWGPDITYFLPEIDIRDEYTLHSKALFTGRDLKLNDVEIHASKTELFGDINILYVDNSRPLFLDAVIVNSTADYNELRRRLPFIPLPELPFISQSRIERIHMRGAPDDSLWFDIHVSDRPGRFDGEWSLYLRGPEVGYRGNLEIKRGQLKAFLPADSKLDTDLNGRLIVEGVGFEPETMKASVDLQLDRSTVSGFVIRKTALLASADGEGNLFIDTLDLELPPIPRDTLDTLIDVANTQLLAASGVLHAQDMSRPKYEFNVSTKALDLAGIFGEPGLPHRITADLEIDARGFELDSLIGTVTGKVKELALADRALLPFDLKLISRNDSVNGRHLELASSFATVSATGKYVPSALFSSIGAGIEVMVDVVSARLQHFADSSYAIRPLKEPLTPVDVRFVATVDDPVPLNAFFPPGMSMSGAMRVVGRLAAGTDTLYVDVDTARVQDLRVEMDSLLIESDPLEFRLNARLRDLHTAPKVTSIDLSAKGDSLLRINDLNLMKPLVTLSLGLDTGSIVAQSDINEMAAYVRAKVRFSPERATVDLDSAAFVLDTNNRLAWHTKEPSIVAVDRGVYTFKGLKISRDSSETISVDGRMSLSRFDSLHVHVENFSLTDVTRFVPVADDNPLHFVSGVITSASAKLNGSWEKPDIDITVKAQDIAYNEAYIGDLNAELKHHDRTVTGFATIDNIELEKDKTKDSIRTLNLTITTLGLDLGLKGVNERLVPGKPVDIQLVANDLSLAAAEPFLPAVERVRGTTDAEMSVKGTSDNMQLAGKATFVKTSFRTQATNVYYVADGSVSLQGERLVIDTVVIRNVPRDYRARVAGVAYASGHVQFDGLAPKSIDFTLRTTGLTVMNAASAATSPTVYGDLAIATGASNPIHMYGSIDGPTLDGEVHVLYGNLTMPKDRSSTKKRITTFDYVSSRDSLSEQYGNIFDVVRKSHEQRPKIDTSAQVRADSAQRDSISNSLVVMPDDTTAIDTVETPTQQKTLGGFTDNMLFNLSIYFDGPTLMTMEIGQFETLVADLGMDVRRTPLKFRGRFIDNSIDLSGKLVVKDGESEYFFLKTFKAKGLLDFDRGGLEDPALNLTATYNGSRQTGDAIQEFKVVIDITGTKNKPHLRFSIFVAGEQRHGSESEITADAITLIVFGRTQDELATAQGGIGSSVSADAQAMATSTLLTGVLNDIFGNNAAIRSVSVEQGADSRANRLVVSGQLFGDVSYRFNGTVGDVTGSNTFTVSIPFTVFGDAEALKYFIFEFGRSITNQAGNVTRNDRAWEFKVGARLP